MKGFGTSFGGSASNPAPGGGGGGLFGSTPSQAQPGGTTSLFGTPATAPAPTGGGLFSSPASSSGGLFSTPAPSGVGLFSNPASSSTGLFSTPGAATTGGLFSTPAQPAQGGGLFSTPGQAGSAPSLFGSGGGGTGFFGSVTQSPPKSFGVSGGFAQSTPAGGGLLSSGINFNRSPTASQQLSPIQQAPATFPESTNFSDLPEDFKVKLLALEKYIKEQRLASARLRQRLETSETSLSSVKDQCDSVSRLIAKAKKGLDSDKFQAEQLKVDVRSELKNAETATVTFESAKSNPGTNAKLVQYIMPFFFKTIQELEFRANNYKRHIEEIEDYLRSQQPAKPKTQIVEDILQRLHDYFLAVASQMGAQHDTVQELKDEYLAQLRHRIPDAVDPFEEAAKKEAATKLKERSAALMATEQAMKAFQAQGPADQAASPTQSQMSAPATGVLFNPAPTMTTNLSLDIPGDRDALRRKR
eukprot:CAMPEP_0184754360 /NCGR_PEP_ID=MMETSP0315-20130426/44581_1 /TAXON_ID=101924 /ORGANISM="Rhodosorus marinus, Strain UTEX LB 2760" /LENGTH=471 /DNA_ID=CAMNT_0027233777 /DNA_START=785 /DNA_END=2201 /DNA_ORIENTATION=-